MTTRWVLTVTANTLGSRPLRHHVSILLQDIESDPSTMVVKPSDAIYQQGLDLYTARTDKEWSLTDCISLIVMQQQGLTDALTRDHHFEQAGFRAVFA